jgi:hypothetical protein
LEALQFCYWLQGALELGQQEALTKEQVKIVQDHLNLVLRKVTPQYNVPAMPTLRPSFGVPGQPFPIHDAVC